MVARFDLTTDQLVKDQLLDTRRATAFFARKLNEIPDAELGNASLAGAWTRNHVIAHIGYNARALTRLVTWANTGVETPMYESMAVRDFEINFGATLNPLAIRNLFEHAAISLNVEWRDSPDAAWNATVVSAQGRSIQLSETPWMRTRELWVHAIDLNNGARFADIPSHIASRLLGDIVGTWSSRNLDHSYTLVSDSGATFSSEGASDAVTTVSGTLADLTAWATGRARPVELARLTSSTGSPSSAPVIAETVGAAPRWI